MYVFLFLLVFYRAKFPDKAVMAVDLPYIL